MSVKLTQRRFNARMREISALTPVDTSETPEKKAARIKRLKGNYRLFFEYYFPMYATSPCAWFQVWVAHMLLQHRFIRFILTWFRGCAKSVHADMGYPLFLKAHNDLHCMVLVGQNHEKACILLADIQAQLLSNRRYIADYGEQYSHGHWKDGQFTSKDGCSFHALGLGQSPRGLRNAGHRPTYIVVDDIDTRELSNNAARVRSATDWAMDDLMGCFDNNSQRFIVVNNMPFVNSVMGSLVNEKLQGAAPVPVQSLTAEFGYNPAFSSTGLFTDVKAANAFFYQYKNAWHQLRVNAVDDTGAPSWPEKYTREYWQLMRDDKSHRSWLREYMNQPVVEGGVFKNDWILYKQMLPLDQYETLVAYADPSWKATTTSDYKAVVLVGKTGDHWHIIKVFLQQCSISTMVRYMYDLYESMEYYRLHKPFKFEMDKPVVCDYWIEANANQDLHLEEFYTEGRIRGYSLNIRPDYHAKGEKFGRIEGMSPFYERKLVYHNIAEKNDPDMIRAIEHQLAFEQGSKSPDDYMDALHGAMYQARLRTKATYSEPRTGKTPERKNSY